MRSLPIVVCLIIAVARTAAPQDRVIQRWLVRGPLPAPQDQAERVARDHLGGEGAALPNVEDEGWREVRASAAGGLDLNEVFEGQSTAWSAAYAHTYVFAPEDRTVLLVADSDDDLVIRVNGQRVWVNEVARGLGRGSDTVTVRLAQGWNSLLLKALNRSGGFGLLARLAPAETAGTGDLLLSTARPPGLVAYHYPRPTVTVGPLLLGPALSWRGDELTVNARLSLTAWGSKSFSAVDLVLTQGGAVVARHLLDSLAPGTPAEIAMDWRFADLRRAALGVAPLDAHLDWQGGAGRANTLVSADRLLRLAGGRIEIGSLQVDSAGGAVRRLSAALGVPATLAGRSLDLLAMGLGPRTRYAVNGNVAAWREGRVELCAPCGAGDSLRIEIVPEAGRPIAMMPGVRVREAGYPEHADGFGYARALAGRARPRSRRPIRSNGCGRWAATAIPLWPSVTEPLTLRWRRRSGATPCT